MSPHHHRRPIPGPAPQDYAVLEDPDGRMRADPFNLRGLAEKLASDITHVEAIVMRDVGFELVIRPGTDAATEARITAVADQHVLSSFGQIMAPRKEKAQTGTSGLGLDVSAERVNLRAVAGDLGGSPA